MTPQGISQPTSLPGGAQLAPGEEILLGDRFMMSTIVFYAHTELVLTNRRLYAVRPNLTLGLIPVGAGRSAFPVENIAGISAGTRFDILGVVFGIFGVLAAIVAFGVPSAAPLGVLLLILGIVVFVNAPKQAIEVMNSGGGTIRFPVSFFERERTVEFGNRVSEAVARTSARGVGNATSLAPRVAGAAPVDPEEALTRLESLRGKGLITDSEYAEKRGEILGRL